MSHIFEKQDFVRHVITGRHGFVLLPLNEHYIVLVGGSDAPWSFDRMAYADRAPTDREWAQFVAWQLVEGDS